ncbi:MAG: FAD-binding protein [Gordonibacter sp.]|nr:FAD-binding protein [Gordonibacter sp.]
MELNRRNFLKGALATTAVAAAAVALPGCAPAETKGKSDAATNSADTIGKHTWEVTPAAITDIAETKEYDVVIVGAGLAGVNAAEAAARNGGKVAVIERNTTISIRGVDVGHIGSKYHKASGFDLDPRVATRYLHHASHQTTNYDLIYVWASRSGKVFDYIEELGAKSGISMVPALSGTAKYGNWSKLSDNWRVYPDAVSFVRGGETYDMRDDGQPVNITLGELVYESATKNGAEFIFEARAKQLVGDATSGITGIIATTKDGKNVQYNAKNGVILATGDIGGNQEMVDAFCPISNRSDANVYAPAGFNNGDGILMGAWAGAGISKSPAAPMIHQFTLDTLEFNLTSFIMSWLAVNANGERYGAEMPFEPMLTNARMNTPGNVAWSIFDGNYETYVMQQQPERFDRFTDGLDTVMKKWLDNGKLIKADTLEDLAKQLDIPADAFKATVERYNSMAEAGEDVDFDVPAQWLAPVKTAPFYATKNVCSTLTIPFGLHVNADSQVLTEEDEPIDGLFAIGNVQGDFFGNDYPVHCPGVSHGRCVTFGQLVGEALAKDTVISKTA